jgi:23S rRNA G2069 N7-methylase RlmK/C1962 C5-methylase RlmI
MNELVQKAFKQHELHIIHAKGDGYTLYCIDLHGCSRFFIEVYEELGEIVTYHANHAYKHQDVDKATWSALEHAHTYQYQQEQVKLGKSWKEEA